MAHKGKLQSEFACIECYKDYGFNQMVIIPNRLWLYIADTYDHLCARCIEYRLGRPLSPKDFPNRKVQVYRGQRLNLRTIPINQLFFGIKGWKLPVKTIMKKNLDKSVKV